MSEWITIATFPMLMEAQLARGRLEGEGIECRIVNEHFMNIYPGCEAIVGGVRLVVAHADEEEALAILSTDAFSEDELAAIALEHPKPTEVISTAQRTSCPMCGHELSAGAGLINLLRRLWSGDVHGARPPSCPRCGHSWSGGARP